PGEALVNLQDQAVVPGIGARFVNVALEQQRILEILRARRIVRGDAPVGNTDERVGRGWQQIVVERCGEVDAADIYVADGSRQALSKFPVDTETGLMRIRVL